jgi:hypothetical protein
MAFLDSPQDGPQALAVRRASFLHEILGLVFSQLAGDSIHPVCRFSVCRKQTGSAFPARWTSQALMAPG